ncbi:phytanoyl-CoA dioxygenase family protein [uncultured Chitinophaga sp.]|uniref:phytanoyl-CoA dioxygenase family protein n=1 Tax=uncultured Chitinophaga sp. TaxID=339340 RepID=UPI0025D40F88|nr:phytanoyl-CoA dioxygenase family protein [uncultured Chitinophaga sp.]
MKDVLNREQINQFIRDGFVRIDNAFPTEIAKAARTILWKDTGCDPHDPATWTKPVIWLGMYTAAPFVEAANTAILHSAFDQLAGANRWLPCKSVGAFPVRFPSDADPGDGGWHVDAGFPGSDPADYFSWRINVKSKGRALLMLFLFSDVEQDDAPTRIRVGSHMDVARLLQPAGDAGLSFMELANALDSLPEHKQVLATGKAGTVYLCHPFLVHGAQPHHGKNPRFMAQPPLQLKQELEIGVSQTTTPLEDAVSIALGKS